MLFRDIRYSMFINDLCQAARYVREQKYIAAQWYLRHALSASNTLGDATRRAKILALLSRCRAAHKRQMAARYA